MEYLTRTIIENILSFKTISSEECLQTLWPSQWPFKLKFIAADLYLVENF
jgi:hypothetical protein